MSAGKDLYKLLGLPRGASREDVRRAHRRLVREYHPDANPGADPGAEERFKEVQHAYEVLSDDRKRREYDERLRASSSPGENSTRPRERRATGERSSSSVDLSELVRKLKDIFGNAWSGGSAAMKENTRGGKPPRASNRVREKRVKGPKAQRKEKRVKGPNARKRSKGD